MSTQPRKRIATVVKVNRKRSSLIFQNPEFVGITQPTTTLKDQFLYLCGPYAKHCFLIVGPCVVICAVTTFIVTHWISPDINRTLSDGSVDVTESLQAATWSVIVTIQAVQIAEKLFFSTTLLTTIIASNRRERGEQAKFIIWRAPIIFSIVLGLAAAAIPVYAPAALGLTRQDLSIASAHRNVVKVVLLWQIPETVWWIYWTGLTQAMKLSETHESAVSDAGELGVEINSRVQLPRALHKMIVKAILKGLLMSILWTLMHLISMGPFISRAIAPIWLQILVVCVIAPFNSVFAFHALSKLLSQFSLDELKTGDGQFQRLRVTAGSLMIQEGLLHSSNLLLLTSSSIGMTLFGMIGSKILDILLLWDKSRKLFTQFKKDCLQQQQKIRAESQKPEEEEPKEGRPQELQEATTSGMSVKTGITPKGVLHSSLRGQSSQKIPTFVNLPAASIAPCSPKGRGQPNLQSFKSAGTVFGNSATEGASLDVPPHGQQGLTSSQEGKVLEGTEDRSAIILKTSRAPSSPAAPAPSSRVFPEQNARSPSSASSSSCSPALPLPGLSPPISPPPPPGSTRALKKALANASLLLQDDIANQPIGNILACAASTAQVLANRSSGHWWWSVSHFEGSDAAIAYSVMFLQEILGCLFIFYLMRMAQFCDLTKARLMGGLRVFDVFMFVAYAMLCNQLHLEMGHYLKLLVMNSSD